MVSWGAVVECIRPRVASFALHSRPSPEEPDRRERQAGVCEGGGVMCVVICACSTESVLAPMRDKHACGFFSHLCSHFCCDFWFLAASVISAVCCRNGSSVLAGGSPTRRSCAHHMAISNGDPSSPAAHLRPRPHPVSVRWGEKHMDQRCDPE